MYEAPRAELVFAESGELMNGVLDSGNQGQEWTENERSIDSLWGGLMSN